MDERLQKLYRKAVSDPGQQVRLYRELLRAGELAPHELPPHIPRISQQHVEEVEQWLNQRLADLQNLFGVDMLDSLGEYWASDDLSMSELLHGSTGRISGERTTNLL